MLCPEHRRPRPGVAVLFLAPPPSPPRVGVRTNFRDLDPVWERERERVNRDALTRLKTPEGSADFHSSLLREPPCYTFARMLRRFLYRARKSIRTHFPWYWADG